MGLSQKFKLFIEETNNLLFKKAVIKSLAKKKKKSVAVLVVKQILFKIIINMFARGK